MKVEIWSDVVCPWCSIGKARFESALERFEHRDEVEVVWRSFELDPDAPLVREGDLATHLAQKYGMSYEESQANLARVTGLADAEGLDFRFDQARNGNTFDAHRLIHLAAKHGLQDEAKTRLFKAYLTEGRVVGDPDTLLDVGTEIGLDPDEVKSMLANDDFDYDVRNDERQAAAFGIHGVPFFVLDRKYGLSGAQPTDVLVEVLEKAWAESHPIVMMTPGDGDAPMCDGDNCTI